MEEGSGLLDEKASPENQVTVKWGADRTVDAERMVADLKARLTKWVADYRVVYDNARFSVEGSEIKADPDGTKSVDYFFLPDGLAKDYTWRQMPDRVEAAMNRFNR